jgi:hypothetical protein
MAQRDEHGNAPIVYPHLSGLLSAEQVLVLHRSPGLLLHFTYEQGEPHLQWVEQLTPEEGRPLCHSFRCFRPAYPTRPCWQASRTVLLRKHRTG